MYQPESIERKHFKGNLYTKASYGSEIIEEVLNRDHILRDRIHRQYGDFVHQNRRPEVLVGEYGRTRVIVTTIYDEYVRVGGGIIAEVETKNGTEAVAFLEHYLNSERPPLPGTVLTGEEIIMYPTIPIPRQPIDRINFDVSEAQSPTGKHCLEFLTGSEHPQLMRREMVHGYIEEL